MRIYLAGPMTGIGYEAALQWRLRAQYELEQCGHDVASPLRGISDDEYGDVGNANPDRGQEEYARDKWDVQNADVVIANLADATTVSQGTSWEMAWAAIQPKTFLIVVMDEDNPHWHMFPRRGADLVVKTIDDAVTYIQDIL